MLFTFPPTVEDCRSTYKCKVCGKKISLQLGFEPFEEEGGMFEITASCDCDKITKKFTSFDIKDGFDHKIYNDIYINFDQMIDANYEDKMKSKYSDAINLFRDIETLTSTKIQVVNEHELNMKFPDPSTIYFTKDTKTFFKVIPARPYKKITAIPYEDLEELLESAGSKYAGRVEEIANLLADAKGAY